MAELYQLVGTILRDVSQARFMSDLYSRQISNTYESDSLLRRFPVPRGEINEVEFQLPFVVTGVRVDKDRHQSRNAAIGRIFDDFSLRVVRAAMKPLQEAFDAAARSITADQSEKKTAADRFQAKILSDDARNSFHGRILRYLNERTEEFLPKGEDGEFNTAEALKLIVKLIGAVEKEPVVEAFKAQFGDSVSKGFEEAREKIKKPLDVMAEKVNDARKKYPDYAVDVEVGPGDLQGNPAASYIKVKAVVKNYRWSKVDVDSKEMRNLRTLVPE
jgi:hypothetical protein